MMLSIPIRKHESYSLFPQINRPKHTQCAVHVYSFPHFIFFSRSKQETCMLGETTREKVNHIDEHK
jgi:hypothetical protein